MSIAAPRASRASSEIVYVGEAVASGSMDVRELGPALVGLGELCEQANRLLNADQTRVRVAVRALHPGSVGISYELIQEIVQQAQVALQTSPLREARDILVTLGLVAAPGTLADYGASVIRYLKWLAGRKPVPSVTLEGDAVNVHVEGDNNPITIIRNTFILASDAKIQSGIAALLKPLEDPGIERLEIRDGPTVVETVTRTEAAPLVVPVRQPEVVLSDDTRDALVEVVKPSFKKELKWRFSEGGGSFGADIDDERFLERVANGEKFSRGHMLRVRLKVKKTRASDGRLAAEHRIAAVLEDFPAPEQAALPLPPPTPTPQRRPL